MIAALRYFAGEALTSLWRGRRSSALSILTIAVALFMLGLFLLLSENLERVVAEWGRSAELSIYLQDSVTPAERSAIEAALRGDRAVAGVDAVSKDAALARFRRDFPALAPATEGAADNPFPSSLEARLSPDGADAAALEKLATRLAGMPGVADVRYDRRWLDRLVSLGRFFRWSALALVAVLVLAAALTVTNVVRLALYARRDEVEIMELVGAPMSFIRGPFVVEGIVQGGIGALVALAALHVGLDIALPRLASLAAGIVEVRAIEFLAWRTIGLLILGGMAVGCVGGLAAARRLR